MLSHNFVGNAAFGLDGSTMQSLSCTSVLRGASKHGSFSLDAGAPAVVSFMSIYGLTIPEKDTVQPPYAVASHAGSIGPRIGEHPSSSHSILHVYWTMKCANTTVEVIVRWL